MVGGKRLSDDELLVHYTAIANRLGGKATARYCNAICLVMGDGEVYEHFGVDITSSAFYIVDTPHTKRVEGYPLDCLSVNIESGTYYYDEAPSRARLDHGLTYGFQAFFKRVLAQHDTICHYDALIDENNDPVHDPASVKDYMDKWDGADFIEVLQLSPEKSVLEIGVGTGRLAVRVCGQCAGFTGIDLSSKTIQRARENLSAFSNIELLCGDFLTYGIVKTFDVIYSSLTFMHIADKQAATKKAAALLNPNGRFVLSIEKNQTPEIDYGTRKIVTHPDTPGAINAMLSEAGLLIEKQFETEFAHVFVTKKGK
jgi:SAM-dependent methyltransferase